jgi:hypothetical protein
VAGGATGNPGAGAGLGVRMGRESEELSFLQLWLVKLQLELPSKKIPHLLDHDTVLTACVRFCCCDKIPEKITLKKERFGVLVSEVSVYGGLSPLLSVCDEAEYHGRKRMEDQNCSPQGIQETGQDRKASAKRCIFLGHTLNGPLLPTSTLNNAIKL